MTVFFRSILSIVFVVILAAFVTGCDLIGDAWNSILGFGENLPKRSAHAQSLWAVNQEGGGTSPSVDCSTELSAAQAVQAAQNYLANFEEALELQGELAAQGNNLEVQNAIGCISLSPANLPDGLYAPSGGQEESTLVEIPAGPNAALYVMDMNGDKETWASIKETEPNGEKLYHIQKVVPEEGSTLPTDANGLVIEQDEFFIPDAQFHAELVDLIHSHVLDPSISVEDEFIVTENADSLAYNDFMAQAIDPELDWSHAEIIVDDETDEALLYVPEASAVPTSSEGLWSPLTDAWKAQGMGLVARIQLKRELQSAVRNLILQKDPAGLMFISRLSRAHIAQTNMNQLNEANRLCGFNQYGPTKNHHLQLCKNAWNKWYKKQFVSQSVIDQSYKGYNNAPSDTEKMAYIWDDNLSKNLLLAGSQNLTKSESADWLANTQSIENYQGVTPAIDEALSTLNSISYTTYLEWHDQLSNAILNNTFDEIYDQLLLTEEFKNYEQAYLQLYTSEESHFCEDTVRQTWLRIVTNYVNTPAPSSTNFMIEQENAGARLVIDQIEEEIYTFLLFGHFPTYNDCEGADPSQGCGPLEQEARSIANTFANQVSAFIGAYEGTGLLFRYFGIDRGFGGLADFGDLFFDNLVPGDAPFVTAKLLDGLVQNLLFLSNNPSRDIGLERCSESCSAVINDLGNLLDWLVINKDEGADAGLGTLLAAMNATGSGWRVKAFWGDSKQTLNFNDSTPYMVAVKPENLVPGENDIVAAVHATGCKENSLIDSCESDRNIDRIANWVLGVIAADVIEDTVKFIQENQRQHGVQKGVVVVAFTESGNRGRVGKLVESLNEAGLSSSNIPIIIASKFSGDTANNGTATVEYTCVGSVNACDNIRENMRDIACSFTVGTTAENCEAEEIDLNETFADINSTTHMGFDRTLLSYSPPICDNGFTAGSFGFCQ